jgi:hypothetical protein
MISLRRLGIALPTLLVASVIGACATGDFTQPIARSGAATADKGDDDHRNPTPCPVSARVVVDRYGTATMEVRAGNFDAVTGAGAIYGKINRVVYTVTTSTGQTLLVNDVKVSPPNPLFTTSLTLLQGGDDATGKAGKSDHGATAPVHFDASDKVSVTVTIDRPSLASHQDATNDANNLAGPCTATVQAVIIKPADLLVGPFERLVTGGASVPAPDFGTVSPATPQTFSFKVSSPLNSLDADATCSLAVSGTNVGTPIVQWLTQQVHLTAGSSQTCQFTLTLPNPGTFTLAATATSADDPNPSNNTSTGTIVVRPSGQTIDVFVRSIAVDQGGGLTTPVGQIAANAAAQYVAAIAVKPGVGNQTSAPVSCSVKVTNLSSGAITTVPGTMSGPATAGADAFCRFSLTLASNANADVNYGIEVTVLTIGVANLDPTNTLAVNQAAIVRTDVSVSSVQMTVDGVLQGGLTTIPQGKTAVYTATFMNNSSRDATATCVVTAGAPSATPAPLLLNTPAQVTVGAGRTATCSFSYVFTQLVAENFTVTAANVSPIDANPDNNVFIFQTTSQSDHTFPGIDYSNVYASQNWVTDANGVPTVLNQETANITRITLTFAATTAILGDFKLSGTVTTDGRPLSNATWTVLGLTPGQNGFANCVKGVDPGYTSVNNQILNLSICAQEVPGQPGTQAIFVEYNSSFQGTLNNPNPQTLFGSSITFNVSLGWTLFGSQTTDHAGATLQFQLQQFSQPDYPNVHQLNQSGLVTVVRNGG